MPADPTRRPRILVCDPIAPSGVAALAAGAEVEVRTGLPSEKVASLLPDFDGVVVRSETKVGAGALAGARRLRVIGRAGTGVDNIDVAAATERGIVVVNAPAANSVSAAEHTIALLFALARNVPQADASLKQGVWDRKRFLGVELAGKTLGLVGLGQVGAEVARRARGLGMTLLAHDPYVSEERARTLGVELLPLEDLLARADFVTLHVPLTEGTRNLLDERRLEGMKRGARLVNTARGGLVDEAALVRAVTEGRLAGAALDVFQEEPPRDPASFRHDRIVVTPHLGASTAEAQERVALDVAREVLAVLEGRPARYAVNAPFLPPESLEVLGPYVEVARKVALVAAQLCAGQLEEVAILYAGDIAAHETSVLRAGVIRGLLERVTEERVNVVNADLVARRRGLRISEERGPAPEPYHNLVCVRLRTSAGPVSVSGTLAPEGARLVSVGDFSFDVPLESGSLLLCENTDRPGRIGAVGTLLGGFDVNVSFMTVGRHAPRGQALMVLVLDEPLTPEQLRQVQAIPGISAARLVRL
ncbi:MAG TPA: phosphoglycerate dehydrogenase [Planctomycetota bacterium]|nr:phosphoglycerate dehydrogenase [Planctomycetota bacterium]